MAKGAIGKSKRAVKGAIETVAEKAPAPSPNPMTNLIIADLALRGGARLLRRAVERTVLKSQISGEKTEDIIRGRTMAQTLIGTAIARIATRSVPGALVVGGGLVAKALYDRRKGKTASRAKGAAAIAKQAEKGRGDT